MNYWHVAIFFAVFYLVHMVLSLRQMRNFSQSFVELRKQGLVVVGKHQNLFSWGALIMFRIDSAGVIHDGRLLAGVTVFARCNPFPQFNGVQLQEVADYAANQRLPKAVRRAIENAQRNYNEFSAGRLPQDPLGSVLRIYAKLIKHPAAAR